MVLEQVHSYERLLPGRKTRYVKVHGYKRPTRKASGKTLRELPKAKLGYIRDKKTGWIIGTYVIKRKRRR
jgi:hypothetical protein